MVTVGNPRHAQTTWKVAPVSWESGESRAVPCSRLGVRRRGLCDVSGFWPDLVAEV